jgi:hypothetical protein
MKANRPEASKTTWWAEVPGFWVSTALPMPPSGRMGWTVTLLLS